jgi:hypothetical protein
MRWADDYGYTVGKDLEQGSHGRFKATVLEFTWGY